MLQARFFPTLALLLCLFGGLAPLPAQESRLAIVEIKAGAATLRTEVARTPAEKAQGLMHRRHLDDNAAMLFILDGKSHASFWMKDTPLPLSIAFLDAQGVILEIADMQPLSEASVRSASDRVMFALETNQHWFSLNRVKAGDKLVPVGTTWAVLAKGK